MIPGPGCSSEELAEALGAEHHGPAQTIRGVAPLEDAGPGELAYAEGAPQGEAGVLLCRTAAPDRATIVVEDPKLAFIQVLEAWFPERHTRGIHPSAQVLGTLGRGVSIGASSVIERGAVIGDGVVIYPGVYVGRDCEVGAYTVLFPRVVLYPGTRVGRHCRLHAGVVLGADGFSYHPSAGGLVKVPQVGRVVVEDEVEIGANTCIDRAFLRETRIGRGSKLDNLVQVGHNTRLGESCLLAAQAGLSGSVELGNGVVLGGQAGVADHLRVGDGARIGAQSGVMREVPAGQSVFGSPARPLREALRIIAALPKLPGLLRGR